MEDPQMALYFTSKRFFLEIETVGILTMQVVQACILLALYSFGLDWLEPTSVVGFYLETIAGFQLCCSSANLGCFERPLSTLDLRSNDLLLVNDLHGTKEYTYIGNLSA